MGRASSEGVAPVPAPALEEQVSTARYGRLPASDRTQIVRWPASPRLPIILASVLSALLGLAAGYWLWGRRPAAPPAPAPVLAPSPPR